MKCDKFHQAALIFILGAAFFSPSSRGQITIPGDGSDGALAPTGTNLVIDLSQAATGAWNEASPHPGSGVYDSNQWAVVFKYISVNIPAGTFVTFTNHPSRAPVVWLVSGNVTITGDVSLDGQTSGYDAPRLAEPGPGGFRGGTGNFSTGVVSGPGFGPGGGHAGIPQHYGYYDYGTGGGFGTAGQVYSQTQTATYGNPSLLPLIGGSGGGGYDNDSRGGGAGGGAILIACAGTVTISGDVHANGGNNAGGGGGGSGGGVRIVANTLAGAGVVQSLAGAGSFAGGVGRIRIERATNNNSLQVNPDPSVLPLQAGDAPLIWLPSTGPTATILSISGLSAPGDPRASFGTFGPDVTLPLTNSATVVVQTVNAESASQVFVRVSPRANGDFVETPAALVQTNSLSPLTLLWSATNVPVNPGYSAVVARVIRP